MCDPLTIAGIALSAAGVAAGQMASSKVAKARDDVLSAERIRQGGFDKEAAALNTQSQDRYQDAAGQQKAKATEIGDYLKGQQIEADTAANAGTQAQVMPTSSSNITVQAEKSARDDARGFTDDLAMRKGDLRSFGDFIGDTGRLQARDASKIGQLGGFKKGSSDVASLELDSANGAGNGIKLIGDLLGAAGGVGTAAGLKGSFTGAAPTIGSAGSMAAGRANDLSSVAGYTAGKSGLSNLFGIFG